MQVIVSRSIPLGSALVPFAMREPRVTSVVGDCGACGDVQGERSYVCNGCIERKLYARYIDQPRPCALIRGWRAGERQSSLPFLAMTPAKWPF